MMDSEQSGLPQPANGLSSGDSQMQKETEVFCQILERLNSISLEHTRELLNLALTAAEKLHPVNQMDNPATAADRSGFVDRSKEAFENIRRDSQAALKNLSAPPDGNSFSQMIGQAIRNAVENSVANQQQLNIIGAAILSNAASLLLGDQSAE